jgi:hypothetical protein
MPERRPMSEEELERVRNELKDAFERAHHRLEWTEILLLLSEHRAAQSTNETDRPPE